MTDDEWLCPRCGATNETWRNWCRSCSATQHDASAAGRAAGPAQAPAPMPAPHTSHERVHPAVAIVVLLAIMAAGAGAYLFTRSNGSAKSTMAANSTASSDPRNADQLAADELTAQQVVLQLGDLPAGWQAGPRSTNGANGSPEEVVAEQQFALCLGVDPDLVVSDHPKSPSTAKSDKFTSGKSLEVTADVTIEPNADEAAAALTILGKPESTGCFRDFIDAAVAQAINHPADGEQLPPNLVIGQADVTPLDLAGLHGEFAALRASVPVSVGKATVTPMIDLVFALKGRAEFTFSFDNIGEPFPADLELQVMNAVLDRAPAS